MIEIEEQAVKQILDLVGGDNKKAFALNDLIENKNREDKYVCYWEPHPEQQKFWDQLTPEQDTWLILGGNSSGKSDLGEWLTAVWLLGKDYFRGSLNWKWVEKLPVSTLPTSVRGVGLTDKSMLDPMWEKLRGATEHPPFIPANLVESENRQSLRFTLKIKSKFHTMSGAAPPKTHGGPSLDLVHIDEECEYEIFKENQRRIRKHGAKMLVTATPLDDVGTTSHPWIFDLIEQWKSGDPTIGVIFMEMKGNPHLDPEFVRREYMRLEGLPDAQARLYGIPTRRSGLFYSDWKAEPPLWVPAYDIPADGMRVVVVDPASTGPVGVTWWQIDDRGNLILYRLYKEKGLKASEHCQNIIAENRGDPIDLWFMDPYMGRQKQMDDHRTVLQVWRDSGLPRLRLADADYDMSLLESKEYMGAAWDSSSPHPRLTVFDHLEKFKGEMERYIVDSVAQGARKGESRDRPRKGNSDLIETYQYLCGMRLRARGGGFVKLVAPELRSYT